MNEVTLEQLAAILDPDARLRAEGASARRSMRGMESCPWPSRGTCLCPYDYAACGGADNPSNPDYPDDPDYDDAPCWCARQWRDGYAAVKRDLYEAMRRKA